MSERRRIGVYALIEVIERDSEEDTGALMEPMDELQKRCPVATAVNTKDLNDALRTMRELRAMLETFRSQLKNPGTGDTTQQAIQRIEEALGTVDIKA